jgi:hypothetical protein
VLFTNYDLIWFQIQEMLRIEKGGEAQIKDELEAYKDLLRKILSRIFEFRSLIFAIFVSLSSHLPLDSTGQRTGRLSHVRSRK